VVFVLGTSGGDNYSNLQWGGNNYSCLGWAIKMQWGMTKISRGKGKCGGKKKPKKCNCFCAIFCTDSVIYAATPL